MDYIFTYPKEKFEEGTLDKRMVAQLISKHRSVVVPQLEKNKQYYDGKHQITEKTRKKADAPNQKTVCNHAKDISDTASGYFMGNPITFSVPNKQDITPLLDAFEYACVDDVDQDNALLISIYGKAYDYTYAGEDEAELKVRTLNPENTFIVYDDTIEHNELFGVYYYLQKDDVNNTSSYIAIICTAKDIQEYVLYPDNDTLGRIKGEPVPHNLGFVPITEYKNNKFDIGDFEQQIGLIDAYNELMADRVNDKEQFVDSILVLYGAILGDDEAATEEARKKLKQLGILELPEDAKAEYLARTLDEAGVEMLRKALKEDIYTFSHVPNLTDENFAGNSSGVAMEYKLLGLEMLTKIKERYYRKGLRKRIKMFCHFLGLKNKRIDPAMVTPSFSRGLPKNLYEIAQMISVLADKVSLKTLIKLLPFVEDPDEEVEAVEAEKEKAIKVQQKMFAGTNNEPVDDDE